MVVERKLMREQSGACTACLLEVHLEPTLNVFMVYG